VESNPSDGEYRWLGFDYFMRIDQSRGTPVLYTFGRVPRWAATWPNDRKGYGPGQASPPRDLNPDGTGTDQIWKNWVTAVVGHAAGRVAAWELWNEPGRANGGTWHGTPAQMARMANDAVTIIRSLNPSAIIISPSGDPAFMRAYYAAGGPTSVDVVSYHCYPMAPEGLLDTPGCINDEQAMSAQFPGLSAKPLWMTEGAWHQSLNNSIDKVAFIGRAYPILWSNRIMHFDWYEWDNSAWGSLWNSADAVIAWTELHRWMVGATMDVPCSATGSVWKCGLTRAHGYRALLVWNTEGNSSLAVPSGYRQYCDLMGQHAVIGDAIAIGSRAILIENEAPF
jgi:hypothetical protein